MSIFFESLWLWLGLSLLLIAFGGATYVGTRNRKALLGCFGAAVVVLGIGLFCVYCVETDYKSISKMLTQLADAIENDDLAKVKTFIHPAATETIIKAEQNMTLVRVTRAKFANLKVESNHMVVPPTAQVTFTAVVHYKFKSGTGLTSMFPSLVDGTDLVRVHFNVELEKHNKSWVVTEKCDFTPSAT